MFRIAICDDQVHYATELESTLITIGKKMSLEFAIEVYNNPTRLMENMENSEQYDILFLDIEMDNLSGIEVGDFIRNHLQNHYTSIVFFSSHTSYHSDLFPITPSGFIHKPITEESVSRALESAIKRYFNQKKDKAFFSYTVNGEVNLLECGNILYFASQMREFEVFYFNHNHEIKSELFYSAINDILEKTKSNPFIQIHRSYVVNILHISSATKTQVTMADGTKISIGRKYSKEFIRFFAEKYLSGV